MYYYTHDVTFSEVPDEVSLTIALAGCVNKCSGCHSVHLRQNIGEKFGVEDFDWLVDKYSSYVTTICFLGGDADPEMEKLLDHLKTKYKLKLCVYSGATSFPDNLKPYLDYYKIGPYIQKKGPLTSHKTNQKMFMKKDNGTFKDITHKFRR